jgi:hypothetical protein
MGWGNHLTAFFVTNPVLIIKKYKALTAATIFYMVFSDFEPFSTNR